MGHSHVLPYRRIHNGATLFKGATESKHFLKKPEAIAVDQKVFEEAISEGVKFIQVFGREAKLYYTATVDAFRERGIRLNRGYGEQYALPLYHWETSTNSEIPKKLREPKREQLSLFDLAGVR